MSFIIAVIHMHMTELHALPDVTNASVFQPSITEAQIDLIHHKMCLDSFTYTNSHLCHCDLV